jgi:1,4-alpha-glucan branching enzyme
VNEVVVRFELALPEARSVALVGSFTSWDITRLPMAVSKGDGTWQVSVRLTKGLIYTYNFVVDGRRWITDPNASGQVDDGFGGHSSVIRL